MTLKSYDVEKCYSVDQRPTWKGRIEPLRTCDDLFMVKLCFDSLRLEPVHFSPSEFYAMGIR